MVRILILLLIALPISLVADDSRRRVAQRVLNDLYISNGNHIYLKPTITITDDDENAALFLRRSNKIELSERLFDVCRSFEKDSLTALAYVLGHELAHVFQEDYEVGNTSFLVYDKLHEDGLFYEESADVVGIFTAFLAGYDTRPILKDLIAHIYDEFELEENLTGYPSLSERQNTITKVNAMSTTLIDIYEGAAYLASIGQYELAAESYAYVERWFKGKEVYNNLGICKIKAALNIKSSNIFPFVLPFELEWTTRMSKPLASRGADDLTTEERKLFEKLIDEAIDYFSMAALMDPTEVGPEINHMCALILKGQPKQALQYSETANLELRSFLKSSKVDYTKRLSCATAIALHTSGQEEEALGIWNTLIGNNKQLPSTQQAIYNVAIANKTVLDNHILETCAFVKYDGSTVDQVRLHRPAPEGDWIVLDSLGQFALCIDQKENSSVYTYKTEDGYFSLQRITDTDLIQISDLKRIRATTLTNSGSISGCDDQKIAIRRNTKGKLEEWIKYY